MIDIAFILCLTFLIIRITGIREELKVEDTVGSFCTALIGYGLIKLVGVELLGGLQWPPSQDERIQYAAGFVSFGILALMLGLALRKKKRNEKA